VTEEKPETAGTGRAAPVAPTDPLRRASDQAARPGFRSPPNARSKAQKAGKKGKKK
jgi:hypothetical protein